MDDRTKVQGAAKPAAMGKKSPKKRKKKVRTSKVIGRVILNMFKMAFVLVCLMAMAASFVAVQVVNYVVEATNDDDSILDLENISLNQTSYIYAWSEAEQDWVEYQELVGPEHRIWVSYDEIPQHLVNAMIAIEDREFLEHHGVSFRRTAYALLNEVFELESGTFGASTIDQQLVKNLTGDDEVGEDGDRSSGYMRKLREIFRAWGLNNNYSKTQIMEAYLNTMGLSENIAGVQAGANEYFNKDVSELTLWECATIAGITRAPTYYSPIQNPDNALDRRDSVLYQMYDNGYISKAEYDEAVAQPLGLAERNTEDTKSSTIFSYFADMVFEDVVADLRAERGWTRGEAISYVYTAGLRIYCTVDLELQAAFEEMYLNGYTDEGYFTNFINSKTGRYYKDDLTIYVDKVDEDGNEYVEEVLPQSAAVSLRYDGSVAAVVGGIGEKEVSLSLNRATDSNRQVGSTMKPIAAYAIGLDYGLFTWSSMLNDSPSLYAATGTTVSASGSDSGAYDWPKNVSLRYRNTPMPIVSAIAESTNTVAVRVGMRVGIETMFDFLQDTLQISSLVDRVDAEGNINSVNDHGASSLVLGGLTLGIKPIELAAAYMMFGGEETYGVYNSVHSYTQVLDSKGSVILKPSVITLQAISEDTGYIMNRLLSTVLNGNNLPLGVAPTARGMAPNNGMDAVAKTGTTNDDVDRWFVGLTPYYVTAVWWGYDENYADEAGISKWTRAATGNVPGNVWKDLMEAVEKEPIDFPARPGGVEEHRYCSVTGHIAAEGCPGSYVGYYSNATLPDTCDGYHGNPTEDEEAPAE